MSRKGRGSTPMWGPGGLTETYRSLFKGEGRSIVVLGGVSFAGGLCEALMLVVLAKLAFAIGGDAKQLDGLGPLDAYDLSKAGHSSAI